MTTIVLWMYGALVASSVIMLFSWGGAARQIARGVPVSRMRWNKALMVASGLTIHAAFMAAACGYRAFDIMANAIAVMGSEAALQVAVLAGLVLSKVMFVWAGAIDEDLLAVRWTWWAFLYAMAAWAAACWAWALGWRVG